jgi:hypothetical protein
MNALQLTDNASATLDACIKTIAAEATNMVLGAWKIGRALNEAKAVIGDDAAFGAWREENIGTPMGISKRTCCRMQNLADKFTEKQLPNVGLSVLFTIASDAVGPDAQVALLERVEADAKLGTPTTAREVTSLVSKLANSRTTAYDIRQETEAKVAAAAAEVELVATAEEAEVADPKVVNIKVAKAAPVKVDHEAVAKEWAANVRKTITAQRKGLDRSCYLFALKQELAAHGLLTFDDDLTVQVNGSINITKS